MTIPMLLCTLSTGMRYKYPGSFHIPSILQINLQPIETFNNQYCEKGFFVKLVTQYSKPEYVYLCTVLKIFCNISVHLLLNVKVQF